MTTTAQQTITPKATTRTTQQQLNGKQQQKRKQQHKLKPIQTQHNTTYTTQCIKYTTLPQPTQNTQQHSTHHTIHKNATTNPHKHTTHAKCNYKPISVWNHIQEKDVLYLSRNCNHNKDKVK